MPYAAAKLSTGSANSPSTAAAPIAPPPTPARLTSWRSSAFASAISSCTSADNSAVAVATSWPRLRSSARSAALIASSVFPRSVRWSRPVRLPGSPAATPPASRSGHRRDRCRPLAGAARRSPCGSPLGSCWTIVPGTGVPGQFRESAVLGGLCLQDRGHPQVVLGFVLFVDVRDAVVVVVPLVLVAQPRGSGRSAASAARTRPAPPTTEPTSTAAFTSSVSPRIAGEGQFADQQRHGEADTGE